MANYVLGKNCKAYYGTTALTSTDSETALTSATEVSNIEDLTINMQKDVVEFNTRANGGWKTRVGTLKDATVSFTMVWKPSDAAFTKFRTAYLTDAEVPFWALDGDKVTEGSQGIAGNFNVSNFTRTEPVGDVVKAEVELVPSSYTHWYPLEEEEE